MPFPSQAPHFACCIPLPLQRLHTGELLAPTWPLPLQLEQVWRMDPVPLQVPHVGIIADFYFLLFLFFLYSQICEMLCWFALTEDGLICILENQAEVTESKMEDTLTEYVTWEDRKGFKRGLSVRSVGERDFWYSPNQVQRSKMNGKPWRKGRWDWRRRWSFMYNECRMTVRPLHQQVAIVLLSSPFVHLWASAWPLLNATHIPIGFVWLATLNPPTDLWRGESDAVLILLI